MPNVIKIENINAPEMNPFASLKDSQLKREDVFIAESVKVIDVALDCGMEAISFLMVGI